MLTLSTVVFFISHLLFRFLDFRESKALIFFARIIFAIYR